jgi:hypothetical protein
VDVHGTKLGAATLHPSRSRRLAVNALVGSTLLSVYELWTDSVPSAMWSRVGSALSLLMVALASSLAALVPYVGWALSFIVMYFMLRRVTEADFRELWIMIIVSRIAAIFCGDVPWSSPLTWFSTASG